MNALKSIWLLLRKYAFPFLGKLSLRVYELSKQYPKFAVVVIFFVAFYSLFWFNIRQAPITNTTAPAFSEKIQEAINIAKHQQEAFDSKNRELFLEKPQPILDELSTYQSNKDWKMLQEKSEVFLSTNHPEIIQLFQNSINEIEKEKAKIRKEKQEQERIKKNEKYITLINRMIKDMETHDVSKYLTDKDSIIIASAVYTAMAMHIDEAQEYDLNDKQKERVEKFKRVLIKRQKIDYPKLRNAYGPAARKAVWENDMTVRTFGKGYKIIEFSGGMFTTNKNIKIFQEGLSDILIALRFKQVRYKWSERVSEYTSYTFDSMRSDAEIISY